jgi:hypothetical protein
VIASTLVGARSIALRIAKGVCRPSHIRSVSVTTPMKLPSSPTTGKWWTPLANISSKASPAVASVESVATGKVAT